MRKIGLLTFLLIVVCNSFYLYGGTPYVMSGGDYSEGFGDIANWTDNFAAGTGASYWSSVGVNATGTIPDGVKITVSTATFKTATSGGVQRGSAETPATTTIELLSTGSTSNTAACAIDLLLDFSGRNAGTLTFDWAEVGNSTGDRGSTLKVYYSTDNITFTELTGTTVTVANNVASSGTVSSITLPASFNNSSTARLRFYEYNNPTGTVGSRAKISLDNIAITSTAAAGPSLSALPSPLSNFSYIAGSGPSSSQTYSLTGSNLTPASGNITITAATDYEFSADNEVSYSSTSVDVAYTGGVISKTIYVRLKSGLLAGNYSTLENVSNAGGGATTQNVSCNGTVYKTEPTNYPTAFSSAAGSPAYSSIIINWIDATGATVPNGYLIRGSTVSYGDIASPSDFTAVTDGGLDKNILAGVQTYTFTGLSASTPYYFKIFPYSNSGTNINYKTDGTVPTTTLTTGAITAGGTYTWSATGTASWATAGNWTPSRSAPSINDILVFSGGGTVTVTNVPTETDAQLLVSGSTIVNLQANAAATILTIGGAAGTDLSVEAASQLNINGANGMTITVATGATGSIAGAMTFSTAAQKITAVDASGLTFQSGSYMTQGTGCSGNIFGASGGTNNSVVFASGSTFIQMTGSNPFANTAPASIVVFQTGSLFSNQQTGTPSFSGRTYANFEQDLASAPTITVTGGSAVSIDNFTVKNGIFNFNMTGTASVIKGNITVLSGATLNFNPLTPGSTVSLGGSSLQTISNAGTMNIGGSNNFPVNIAITNSAGVQLSLGTVTIQNSAKVTLGSNNFTIASGATLTTNSTSYVVTNGTGGLVQNVPGTSTNVTFPVGTSTYNPVVLNNSGTADNFTVNVTNTSNAAAVMKEWTITEAASGANVAVTLQWNTADENGTFVRANSIVSRWNGAAWDQTSATTFTDLGGGVYTAAASGFTAFSPFMVSNSGAMPVELSSFTSNMHDRNIQLNWETKTEVNFNKFEIDRALVSSKDALVTWASVGTVQASGTSNAPKKYSFTEKDLQAGKYQYRLKMIDNDGSYKYSSIVETDITLPKNFELSQNYPNPFNPSTRINYSIPFDSRVTLEVYNIAGEKMGQIVNEEQSAGYYTVNFSSSTLNRSVVSGVYLYKINAIDKSTGNVFTSIKKMMLLK